MPPLRLRSTLWANFALLAAVATVLAAVLRVYAWSGFFQPTSLAVLSVADRGTLLAATLIPLVVGSIPFLATELLFSPRFKLKNLISIDETLPFFGALASYLVPAVLLIVLVYVTPFTTLLVLEGLFLLVLIVWSMVVLSVRVKKGRKQAAAVARYNLAAQSRSRVWPLLIPVAIVTLVTSFVQPWSPLEHVERASGSDLVGYVVGESSGFTLIVSERKETAWVLTDSIGSRALCTRTDSGFWNKTIPQMFSRATLPAACPELDR